ncbi:hypothetical protein MCOR02_005937 [Pyricularia oryzae]|uniref:DNA 3'-5' helicase n=1 Tax=Pyricularia oryzae TaxID=318829 RepID=A0A4P7NKS1_PYROR|nr:hypothetical protein MCOR01_007467 [Pyricularia oryzae]KAH9433901.1 hypothetical protein MCOR02_005937 [Pyricularia oryzae]KAI6278491.1 hypothetical protein MCOR26_004619 [Pyricularia oryzae]KAI6337729.1 hypothetical protein MCOR30_003316 [Pyricularia oryzae]KAI6345121.1 hypothetical protein MCOR28_003745 [Pyricularia oryzae]
MADASSTKQTIVQTLNDAQRRAVSSGATTVAILAGPGSGKTHTLASRVVWQVDVVGYRPQDVVVATFTVKAAREMGERICKVLGPERGRKVVLGTFHSISRRYLAAYGKKIGLDQKFGIADDSDSRAIITRICKRHQLGIDPAMARGWISKKKSRANDRVVSSQQEKAAKSGKQQPIHSRELETCYEEYQAQLTRSNLLDYDDLLVKGVELLRAAPECVSNVQAVLIDEYQDTNGVQYDLMKLLAQRHGRITVVGDPDQSIYGWRSADTRNLSRMFTDFPTTDKVALEENYRSSESILATSLKIIQQEEKRFDKVLKAVHTRGTKPVLRKLRNSAQEAEWIVAELRRTILLSGDMMNHDDVAILLRSAALSRHIESALGKAGIPYRMVGGFKFYERAEIKLILDYLRVVYQPDNNDALARIINVPKRGAGDATIKALLEEAEKSQQSLWSLLRKHCTGGKQAKTTLRKQVEQKISGGLIRVILDIRKKMDESTVENPYSMLDVISQVLSRLDFEQHLKDTYNDEWEGRWANVQEFINLATDFMTGNEVEEELPEIDGLQQTPERDTLARFLANVSLATDVQNNDPGQNRPMVTVSTIHAAKGLEWPVVFIPAAYNGSIPHIRSEDGDEERRLLYVAMTRAKALLYLSYPVVGGYGNGEKVTLSSFLSDVEGYFAVQGPTFNSAVLEELARILRRKAPSQKDVFGRLKPFEVSMEDDIFPSDPEQDLGRSGNKTGLGRSSSGSGLSQGQPPTKRQRMHSTSGGLEQQDQTWHQEYSTTMQQASGFTVSSLPGFVTAGAHHSAFPVPDPPYSRDSKTGQPNRGTGQRSLLGFVTNSGQPRTGTGSQKQILQAPQNRGGTHHPRPPQSGRQQGWGNDQMVGRPAIAPELANHRLGGTRSTTLPRPGPPAKREHGAISTRNQYAHLSSSPTKAQPQEETNDPTSSPPAPTRPVSTFHNTTCTMPQGQGGFKRPAALTREGIAPMDRLRKPFKPLTINRSMGG